MLYLIYEIGYVFYTFNEYMAYRKRLEHRGIKISEKFFTRISYLSQLYPELDIIW
ncbi:hypothetical protein [Vulcanisaeta moutnovskia]|uniref:hypothetical protein n=1 Tax=Vulcanisaeta moutnovskia TaxID=985052 RepID=UPI0013053FEE|nr:hypothetical protein [Vulcanisaeta moutnovskia]